MSEILELIDQQLDDGTVQRMASQIDATPEQTGTAMAAALPALLAAWRRTKKAADVVVAFEEKFDRRWSCEWVGPADPTLVEFAKGLTDSTEPK